VTADETTPEPEHVRQARYLGADAALAAASWVEMTEADARSILEDVDPEVLDRYPEPNLSGEWADDPTPVSLAHEVGANDGDIAFWSGNLLDPISEAWEEGRDAVWSDALQAHALRTLGRIDDALTVERQLEARVAELRTEAGR
jgi:hypothetical protein